MRMSEQALLGLDGFQHDESRYHEIFHRYRSVELGPKIVWRSSPSHDRQVLLGAGTRHGQVAPVVPAQQCRQRDP